MDNIEHLQQANRKALAYAISVIYFDDSSDFKCALWDIVRTLGGDEVSDLLENDEQAAYHKYVEEFNEEDEK